MLAALITLSPLLAGMDRRATLRLCSASDRRITGLGGIAWEPAATTAPALGMQFWNGDFDQANSAGRAQFDINIEQVRKRFPEVLDAVWPGAQVEIMLGRVGDAWPWTTHFVGRVTAYNSNAYPALSITAEVDLEPFNVDVLNKTYAGTSDAEGGPDIKGRVKPLALGRPLNVEPVLINAVDSVYQFSAYGPIEAVTTLYERASAFPAASGNYASYAALVAADIDPGHWATCLAEGLIRLGAPAYGVITGDIRGHAIGGVAPRGAGALVAVIADIAGVSSGLLGKTTLAALDAEGATNSDIMIVDQVKFVDAARRLILPCNWQVVVSNLGVLMAMKPSFNFEDLVPIHAQGRSTPLVVGEVAESAVSVPYSKSTMAYARCWRVHSLDEIASAAPLVDRGTYDASVVYREGNIVSMPGGSRWLFIATTPQAGVTPGTNFAVWALLQSGATYADGTPIDDLQPDEGGAQITRNIALSESTVLVTVDAAGAPIGGQLPRTVQATFSEANYDVTLATSWAIFPAPGITASIDDTPGSMTRGRVTITGMTAAGSITVTATRGNVVATASIAVVAKGVLSDLNQADTGNLTDNAATVIASFFKSFTTTVGAAGTWMPVDDGSDAATVTVATGSKNVQQIFIDAYMGVRRAGSSNDIIEYRVRRDDGVILPQVWDVEATNDKAIMAFAFLDANPSENVTHTYALQMKSDDASTPIYEVFLKALLGKTG